MIEECYRVCLLELKTLIAFFLDFAIKTTLIYSLISPSHLLILILLRKFEFKDHYLGFRFTLWLVII